MFSTSHLHPMLVHFPIALVIVGFLSELAFLYFKKEVTLSKMGFYLLIIGTIAACAAWLAGNFFTSDLEGAAGKVQALHELFANITLGLLLFTSAIRIFQLIKKNENPQLKWFAFAVYALAALSVSITGLFGGTLVYSYMVSL
ncbi:MAG: DUF2231 domain-containing protein [Paludibacter sp.]|nr:DUF2231 domain-containing protein [Paludibacter sp.]